ncbi:hypothetical protein D3C75_1006790 [compost metagenome]
MQGGFSPDLGTTRRKKTVKTHGGQRRLAFSTAGLGGGSAAQHPAQLQQVAAYPVAVGREALVVHARLTEQG